MRWYTHPLLWFLLVGAVLFGVQAWRSPASEAVDPIVVDASVVALVSESWRARTGTDPDDEALRGLLTTWVNEELLYREALALGLERDDEVIRQRLIATMRLLYGDMLEGSAAPTDAELQALMAEEPNRWRRDPTMDLEHVFFRDGEAGTGLAQAIAALPQLREGADPASMGDAFVRGRRFAGMTDAELARDFGARFARQLADAEPNTWIGPLQSDHGTHLVRILERHAAQAATLEDARRVLTTAWRERQVDALQAERLTELRARYVIDDQTGLLRDGSGSAP